MKKKIYTCVKRFGEYPFAHRQPKHDGHCALIHGHNWSFQITFEAALDKNGFVIDFGKLDFVKAFLSDRFDHTLVLCADDPNLDYLLSLDRDNLARIVIVESASAEGLAEYVFVQVNALLQDNKYPRVKVVAVTVYENQTNFATFQGK